MSCQAQILTVPGDAWPLETQQETYLSQ